MGKGWYDRVALDDMSPLIAFRTGAWGYPLQAGC
jgi:hypothetical protein